MWCDDVCGHFANIMKRSKESQRCWFRVLMSLNQCHYCLCGNPPKMKLSSGGRDPCSTGFPYQVSVLGIHLYQCTSWWEAAFSFIKYFLKIQHVCPLHEGDLWAYLPTPHWVVSSFWPKTAWGPIHPKQLFCFVSLDEKRPQRETFADVVKVK